MNGIKFGSKHTYDDWDLILVQKSIGFPSPKTSSVDIEGADGALDTSEVLTGEIKFSNRTLAFEFAMTDDYEDFEDKITEISNYLHGRKFKIILDSDPLYYYYGRASINQWSSDKRVGKIVIYCDCDPYKYELNDTTIIKKISGRTNLEIIGKRMTVCPIITASSDMTMIYGNKEISLLKGENQVLDLFIKEGKNLLKFDGYGEIKISYKGGVL